MTQIHLPADADLQQSLAILYTHDPNAAFQSIASLQPPHPRQIIVSRGRKVLQRGPRRSKFLVGAVVCIVSLVTLVALLAVCRSIQRRVDQGAATPRNLSDTAEDQERSGILDQCLDLEAEHGIWGAGFEDSGDATEAKARLVSMLQVSAAAFEHMQILTSQGFQDEAHSPLSKFFRLDESWQSTSHPGASAGRLGSDRSGGEVGSAFDPFSADAWRADPAWPVFGEEGQQVQAAGESGMQGLQREVPTSRTSSSDIYEQEVTAKQGAFSSVGSATSSEDALNPAALLDYHSANMFPQALQHSAMGTALQNPTVDATSPAVTNAAPFETDRRAGIVGRGDSHGGLRHDSSVPLIQMKAVQQLERQAHAFDGTFCAVGRSVSIPALRAPNSDPGEPSKAGDVRLHPFVRLPVVNPRDIHRIFRAEFALSLRFPKPSPMESYTTMRSLFAKASLTPEEIKTLIREAELVACYANDKLTRPLKRRRANYLFVKLSSIFMAFDHLVCTIELLGEKMNTGSWWAQFVQKFHTDYCFSERGRNERTEMLNKLVNRLSAALSIYKDGRRPAFTEIIELKRAIISHAYKRTQLSNPLWKLWMEDDNKFACSSNGLKDPSVGEAPGHREASTR